MRGMRGKEGCRRQQSNPVPLTTQHSMAPAIPKKHASARVKTTRAPRPHFSIPASETETFPSSKKDKRTIKHSAFMGKIEKTSKAPKRRRPNKKLVADLESLADALPGLDDLEGEEGVVVGQAKIQRKSLKSKPGAMKKKAMLEKVEKERFNKNLVQMVRGTAGAGATSSVADRWAALKSHVQGTMERKPEFIKS
ncbi:hypothetical protein K504DRAFT_143272 [Pleomassaria siparia CBS 279.74]|uniref:Ribosome biogenesis protein SLX9 n=1 Tax=Pleomassaria siparia CBS 279.74 TaxID=1314801 RepID=A0A6G1KMM0_9PLEO|nr:hypothetical protein K504DRAFT_143272 [Pleomassaria siparia CBS 279.74]